MITEKNTIKIRTEYTVEAKKEFFAPSRKTSNKLILGSLAFAHIHILLLQRNRLGRAYVWIIPVLSADNGFWRNVKALY